jgi:formylglycine-generating enzyme required for sulfatase activity
MYVFVQCVAEAVADKGLRTLAELIPGGAVVYDIAEAAWKNYRSRQSEAQQRDELRRLAQTSVEEARQIAAQVAHEVASRRPDLASELQEYLARIPDSIRHFFKTPDDPSGTTIPITFSLHGAGDFVKLLPVGETDEQYLAPGRKLGRFTIEAFLARGGMGQTLKAHDPQRNATVVIKTLPVNLWDSPQDFALFLNSFRLVWGLHHQHIWPVYDLLDQDLRIGLFLVMKYHPGITLAEYRRRVAESQGRFTPSQVQSLLRPIAEALDYTHRQKVIHRDVKPANIMLEVDGSDPQLLDFGLAEPIHRTVSRVPAEERVVCGTLAYMSPEQWQGQAEDGGTDQYALAVTAYELLAGKRPFPHKDAQMLRLAVLSDAPPPIEGLDGSVRAALNRALEKQASRRFPTCTDFIDALRAGQPAIAEEETAAALPIVIEIPEPVLIDSDKVAREQQGLWAQRCHGSALWTGPLGMAFRLIPPGKFLMGALDPRAPANERPARLVTIARPLWVAEQPFTNEEFRQVLLTETNDPRWPKLLRDRSFLIQPNSPNADLPLTQVALAEAEYLCQWLSRVDGRRYRLPTEAEWEYCARARTPDPPGEDRDNVWGVKGVPGNIAEWTCSAYAPLETGAAERPAPAHQGEARVVRGGSATKKRLSQRMSMHPSRRASDLGFRVVCEWFTNMQASG